MTHFCQVSPSILKNWVAIVLHNAEFSERSYSHLNNDHNFFGDTLYLDYCMMTWCEATGGGNAE